MGQVTLPEPLLRSFISYVFIFTMYVFLSLDECLYFVNKGELPFSKNLTSSGLIAFLQFYSDIIAICLPTPFS